MTHREAIAIYNELAGIEANAPIPESLKSDIRRLYRYVTGETMKHCNCPDLYNDALILIRLKMKNNTFPQKYILKRGIVIQSADSPEVYTRDNITDDVAKAYLAKFPNRTHIFEAIPTEVEEVEDTENIPAEVKNVEVAPKTKKTKKTRK